MTLENEKRFLLLLSSFMQEKATTKKNVLDFIESQKWINLTDKDKKIKENINEPVWRNDLAFIRKHLSMDHYFSSGIRNDWSVTKKGEDLLFKLFQEVKNCNSFSKITNAAIMAAENFLSSEAISLLMPYDEFAEGKVTYKKHLVRERNRELIEKAKNNFKIEHNGSLFCQICGFDFLKVYGKLGEDFIEAHHTKPVSEMQENEKTKIEDIVMVCSNCHSMIHRKRPWLNTDKLKSILSTNDNVN